MSLRSSKAFAPCKTRFDAVKASRQINSSAAVGGLGCNVETSHSSAHAYCISATQTNKCFSCAKRKHLVSGVCVYMGLVLIPSPHAECFVARHTSPSVVVHMHLVSGMVCGYGSCAYPITARKRFCSKAYESKCCCAYTLGLGHGGWLWVLCLSHHPTACCDMSPWEVFCPVLESKTTSLLEH